METLDREEALFYKAWIEQEFGVKVDLHSMSDEAKPEKMRFWGMRFTHFGTLNHLQMSEYLEFARKSNFVLSVCSNTDGAASALHVWMEPRPPIQTKTRSVREGSKDDGQG